jgi:hypothetical protein
MCHPVITAYKKLEELKGLEIRSHSLYYDIWLKMIEGIKEYIRELERRL